MTTALLNLATSGKLAQNAAATPKGQQYPTGSAYIAEPKMDGWRILAHVHEDGVTLFSRSGNTYSGKLPKIEAELAANFPAGTWIDGEAVAISYENGKVIDKWGTVQTVLSKHGADSAADKITFMVFDLLAHGGHDARKLPLVKRRILLDKIFKGGDFDAVALTPMHEADEGIHDALVAMGFEGTMIKRLNAPYASGKRDGSGWIKVKPQHTVDAVIMGFKAGESGFAGMVGAVVFGQYDENGVLVERGRCSGMDMRTRLAMTNHPEKYLGQSVEIAHMGVSIGATDTGRFRHPQFKRMRPDKAPQMCVLADA